jgi:hypothetical protein
MKLMGIALLSAICWAGTPIRAAQLAPISLFIQSQQAPPAAILEAMQDEVESILAVPGFRFEWHELSAATNAGTAVELAVITLKGTCEVPGGVTPMPVSTHTLGFTSITDGAILPFTTVDCDKTRSFLATALNRLPTSERDLAFGKALGRILAHELYHIFANTQRHGHSGVAKDTYSVSDLLAPEFELDERSCQTLRESRAYSSLVFAASSGATDTR